MRLLNTLALLGLAAMAAAETTSTEAPVVSKLHTVSIHVKDVATQKAVIGFFHDQLSLPLTYVPVEVAGRQYAAVLAGNLAIEPCGPFSNIDYKSRDLVAIYYGLTFESHSSTKRSKEQLDRCAISSKFLGQAFLILNDSRICEGDLGVSIMNNPERIKEREKHARLRAELDRLDGGPLGVIKVDTVEIGYTDNSDIAAWGKLLAGLPSSGQSTWQPTEGPAIRLVKSAQKRILSITIQVRSLDKAAAFLKQNGWLGEVSSDRIEILPHEEWTFRTYLRE